MSGQDWRDDYRSSGRKRTGGGGGGTEKLLPHNTEAEMGVLGAILIDPEAIVRVAEFLTPDDFDRNAHRQIFQAALDLYEAGEPPDFIVLCDELGRRGQLEEIGGTAYIGSLANQVPTSRNAVHYARIVERTAILRRLIHAAGQIAGVAYNEPDADLAMEQAEALLANIAASQTGRGGPRHVGDALGGWFNALAALRERRAHVTGVPTGYDELDRLLSGHQPGDLIIPAGRPSMGKSAYMLCLAHNAAKAGHPALLFSLEMSAEQILVRLVAMMASVDLQSLRTGYLSDDEWERAVEAAGRLGDLPLYIDDTAGLSLAQIRARSRRLMHDAGFAILFVDYIQLMKGAGGTPGERGRREQSRAEEVDEITKGLKALAKELRVPVVALSQLSRAVEARGNKTPQMSDLAESGGLERHADVIEFLYREEAYNAETTRKNVLDVIVGKQRQGPQGQVSLFCQLAYSRLTNLERSSGGLASGGVASAEQGA